MFSQPLEVVRPYLEHRGLPRLWGRAGDEPSVLNGAFEVWQNFNESGQVGEQRYGWALVAEGECWFVRLRWWEDAWGL